MAPIDACHIVQLSHNDMEQAYSLSMEAGWNQTERDWHLFLRHSTVFGIMPEQDHRSALRSKNRKTEHLQLQDRNLDHTGTYRIDAS